MSFFGTLSIVLSYIFTVHISDRFLLLIQINWKYSWQKKLVFKKILVKKIWRTFYTSFYQHDVVYFAIKSNACVPLVNSPGYSRSYKARSHLSIVACKSPFDNVNIAPAIIKWSNRNVLFLGNWQNKAKVH